MQRFLIITGAALGLSAINANANNVNFVAFGDDLAGASVTVEYANFSGSLGTQSANFIATGPGIGQALVPDPFAGFNFVTITVTGNTVGGGAWRITNGADASIIRVRFNLAGSISLFDDSPASTDTPGSSGGQDGIVFTAGTAGPHTSAIELTPWTGAKNAGDLWLEQEITWPNPSPTNGNDFSFQEFYEYSDDTDVIPAPGAMALLVLGGIASARRRR